MAKIRGDFLGPERRLRSALRRAGVRFRRNVRSLPGSPDAVAGRVAVFVHGCFWHGCPSHYRPPKSNRPFWSAKLAGNRARDRRARRELAAAGYVVAEVWEHDLRTDADADRAAGWIASLAAAAGLG